jgi:hypothetical protein
MPSRNLYRTQQTAKHGSYGRSIFQHVAVRSVADPSVISKESSEPKALRKPCFSSDLYQVPYSDQVPPLSKTVLQLADNKKPHMTRKGNVKESTKNWIQNAPKGTTANEINKIWEDIKNLFDGFSTPDNTQLPPTTEAPTHGHGLPKRLDLVTLENQHYNFFHPLVEALNPNMLGNRGAHLNEEGKLPIYTGITPYQEFSYLKGGGRLVIDNTSGRQYISLHYSRFYRIN